MAAKEPGDMLPLTALWYSILLALADEPRHGYGMIKEIEARTGGKMSPGTGTVYLALQRLKEDGLVVESKKATKAAQRSHPDKRRRRWYELTKLGRETLAAETMRMSVQVGIALEKGVVDASSVSTL